MVFEKIPWHCIVIIVIRKIPESEINGLVCVWTWKNKTWADGGSLLQFVC